MDNKLIKEVLKEAQIYVEKPQYILDLFGLKIVWCDDEFAKLLGYSKSELYKLKAFEVIDDSYSEQEKTNLVYSSFKKLKGTIPITLKTKDGKKIKATNKFTQIQLDGEIFDVGEMILN